MMKPALLEQQQPRHMGPAMSVHDRHDIAQRLHAAIVWRAWIDDAKAGQIYAGEMPVREILGTEQFLAKAACNTYTALTHTHPMVRFRALCQAMHFAARTASDPLVNEALAVARADIELLLEGRAQ